MKVWKTAEGRGIPLQLLSDDHLLNILRMLIRKAFVRRISHEWVMLRGPRPRGDGAQMAFEREIDQLAEKTTADYLHENFPDLRAEAEGRGLTIPEMPSEEQALVAIAKLLI